MSFIVKAKADPGVRDKPEALRLRKMSGYFILQVDYFWSKRAKPQRLQNPKLSGHRNDVKHLTPDLMGCIDVQMELQTTNT